MWCGVCRHKIQEHEKYDTSPDASGNNDRQYYHTPCPRKYLRGNLRHQITELEEKLKNKYIEMSRVG